MKKILLIALLASFAVSARATEGVSAPSGGGQPTLNTDEVVYPGMKYKEYKDFYDPHLYVPDVADPYRKGWAGVASFFIPGLGQGIDGEWGRAAWMFGTNVALNLAAQSQTIKIYNTSGQLAGLDHKPLYWAFFSASLALSIYSTIDAVRIAKIKNMYYQDLRAQRSAVDVRFQPYVACTPQAASRLQPAAGLSMVVNF